jgi:hypothetical protein
MSASPGHFALGDDAHPWTEAVQLLLRDSQGAECPFSIPVRRMGDPPGVVALDVLLLGAGEFRGD